MSAKSQLRQSCTHEVVAEATVLVFDVVDVDAREEVVVMIVVGWLDVADVVDDVFTVLDPEVALLVDVAEAVAVEGGSVPEAMP